MTKGGSRYIETLSGTGEVFQGEKSLGQWDYSISVHQDMIDTGRGSIPGQIDRRGTLHQLEGETNLITGDELVLVLQDGRRARFIAIGPAGASTLIELNSLILDADA